MISDRIKLRIKIMEYSSQSDDPVEGEEILILAPPLKKSKFDENTLNLFLQVQMGDLNAMESYWLRGVDY